MGFFNIKINRFGNDKNNIKSQVKYANNISGTWSAWTNKSSAIGHNLGTPCILKYNNYIYISYTTNASVKFIIDQYVK